MEEFHRIYTLKHLANDSKLQKLEYIRKEYIKVAKTLSVLQWNNLFKDGMISESNIYKVIKSEMTARWKGVCKRQVDGMIKSHISHIKNKITKIITSLNVSEELKKELYTINKRQKWFSREMGNYSKESLKLSRKIFKHLLKTWKKPNYDNINLVLNNQIIKIERCENNEDFNYWIKISSFKHSKFIYIPLKTNSYFEKSLGEITDFVQINFRDSKVLSFNLLKKSKQLEYQPIKEKLGIDLGLTNLITTNFGDQFGVKWKEKLTIFDNKIQKLTKNLQKQGITKYKQHSKRYRDLIFKMKEYIKNEIGRIVNKIISLYKPSKIFVEKLNFQNQTLSKVLNRLIGNFGKAVFSNKLRSISELYGIEIVEINPAYTSKTCSKCENLDWNNRKSQSKFECSKCKCKLNADVNAARNIIKWERYPKYTTSEQIKKSLISNS